MSSSAAALLFVVAVAIASANAYKSGAPDNACGDMIPQHHVPAQTSPAPYTLTVAKHEGHFDLTIAGKTEANVIKGFLVEAKQGNKLVGQFVVPETDEYTHYVSCDDKPRVSFQASRAHWHEDR